MHKIVLYDEIELTRGPPLRCPIGIKLSLACSFTRNSRPPASTPPPPPPMADIQEKIAAARREADGLKDKIRAARDHTADTSRESPPRPPPADSQSAPWQATPPPSPASHSRRAEHSRATSRKSTPSTGRQIGAISSPHPRTASSSYGTPTPQTSSTPSHSAPPGS